MSSEGITDSVKGINEWNIAGDPLLYTKSNSELVLRWKENGKDTNHEVRSITVTAEDLLASGRY